MASELGKNQMNGIARLSPTKNQAEISPCSCSMVHTREQMRIPQGTNVTCSYIGQLGLLDCLMLCCRPIYHKKPHYA